MERSRFLPSGRMRITELVVWDCALAFLVVGLLVGETVLVPQSAASAETASSEETPKAKPKAKPKTAKPTTDEPKTAQPKARRRRPGRRRARPGREPAAETGRLKALEAEALGSDDAAAVLAVFAKAKDLADEPGYAMFRAQVFDHVARLDALPALLPHAQHLADRRAADQLAALLAELPSSDQSALDAELTLARRAAPDDARVKTFRPGWREREGRHGKLASDLDDASARRVLEAVDAVCELAETLSGSKPATLTLTVEIDPSAPVPQPGTLRRAKEDVEALVDRARWAVAAHVVAGWKVPAPLCTGVTAFLAGCQDSRGSHTPCAERWERLLHTRGLSGDGEAVLSVLAGADDWLLTWGWVRFAAFADSAQASRKALKACIAEGKALSTWDAGRAADAEQRWVTYLGSP